MSTTTAREATTGGELAFPGGSHPKQRNCPRCGMDLSTTALVDIVYAFEECGCDAAIYRHLREQLWHPGCFVDARIL